MLLFGQFAEKPEIKNWFFVQFERLVPQSEIRFIIYAAVFASLIAIAFYVVMWIRERGSGTVPNSLDYLAEFEDLHDRGAFDDEEMSKLKHVINENIADEKLDRILGLEGKVDPKSTPDFGSEKDSSFSEDNHSQG